MIILRLQAESPKLGYSVSKNFSFKFLRKASSSDLCSLMTSPWLLLLFISSRREEMVLRASSDGFANLGWIFLEAPVRIDLAGVGAS